MRRVALAGQEFINNKGMKCIVLEDIFDGNQSKCLIKFLNTGYEYIVNKQNLKKGSFTDPYERTIYGVACKGKIKCVSKHEKLAFHRWDAMISRCYNKQDIGFKNYGEKGVVVSERWLVFENFYEDLPKIKNYEEQAWLKGEIELDKDSSNNNIYSLEDAIFLTKEENKLMQNRYYKPFKVFCPDGTEKIYTNQSVCGKELGLLPRSIGKCLHGQLNHTRNHRFEYLETQTTIQKRSSL